MKKKPTLASILREYGVDEGTIKMGKKGLRYRSIVEKGVAWYWCARYVRRRDAKAFGTCISCDKPKTFNELQGGHFVPASECGTNLLMDERNVNGECGRCNTWVESHLWGYEKGLNKRYGEGTGQELRRRFDDNKDSTKKYSREEWKEIALKYKKLYEIHTH